MIQLLGGVTVVPVQVLAVAPISFGCSPERFPGEPILRPLADLSTSRKSHLAGNNLVAEQGTVLLLTETDEAGSTSFRRRSSRLEWSETDQGRSDETIEHVQLEYGGELRISAGEGVVVEYERDGSLSASLNELTDSPELAWMDELRGDGDVEWQGVEPSSESWYRSSSGLTAAGKAAAAQAAAESQKSVAGSEDPGVSSLRVYGAGLPSAAGGGGGGGQLLAGVQGAPRNTIRPLPDPQRKDSSGSESGSSQGGTTDGSDTSTLTLKTVDITEANELFVRTLIELNVDQPTNADSVSFRYQDYARGNRNRVLTLDAVEFLRRFLQHVLPDRFVRIRHYGFLANRARKQKLPLCRRLIAQATGQHVITAPDLQAVLDVPDDDHELCPACHAGTMGRIQE